MIFTDRIDAARQLAAKLAPYRGRHPLVLAIPRGGVPMGRVIADALHAELDVVLVHKLGSPGQPELAMGAVDESGEALVGAEARYLHIGAEQFEVERLRQLELLRRRRALYTPARSPSAIRDRIVLVVDDGMATGSTMIAALRAVRRQHPRELVAIAAVMPADVQDRLEREADRVVTLHAPTWFGAVGEFFEDFSPVEDDEVIRALAATPQDGGGRTP